ncbi:MAG: hypothetical protein DDT23_00558 [candidate division WS2 bacterium]|nr:hypothetical protein [Candidatus Lithacetigena glycinireducens]
MFDLTAQIFRVMGLYETGPRFQPERPAIDNSLLRESEELEQGEGFDTIGEMLEAGGHCTCGAHVEEVVDGECLVCGRIKNK